MAGNKVVTASIVIEFDQTEGEGVLQLEVDAREDGRNGGDTNFPPGSSPYLLLFKTSNVVVERIEVSEGSLVLVASNEAVPVSEFLTYANAKTASPQYPIPLGSGTLTAVVGATETPVISESSVTFSTPQVAVAGVDYTAVASVYQLVAASGQYPVVIFVSGRTVQ